jgi:lipopolysaccharide transport system permease protein
LILPTLLITIGLSWIISSFAVILKDLIYMSGFISSVLFYSSAIVYPITKIPHKIWEILKFNPVLLIINESRKILFWQQKIDIDYLIYIYATSLIIFFTGYKIQNYLKGFFAEFI